MKISSFCCLAASFALAAAALTGCKTSSANGVCTDKGACTADAAGCCSSGEKAGSSCCSSGEKKASSCCTSGEKKASSCCASGEKSASAADAKIVNTTCPISGGPAKSTITAAYSGKTVGFCCAGCAGKWEAATDSERAAMFSKVATN